MTHIDKLNRRLGREFGGIRARIVDGVLVLEGEAAEWRNLVRAGQLAAKSAARREAEGLVNRVRWTGGTIAPMRLPPLTDNALDGAAPDVLVIGGGVVGAAIARELSRYRLDILLVEKEHDLAMQASGRNDGMVHPGLDLKKGTSKYHYNRRGNALFDELSAQLGIDFKRTGQLLCFTGILWPLVLRALLLYWKWLGVPARFLGKRELREREGALDKKLTSALFFPRAGIVCPYNLTIALAENAVENGARVSLDTAVMAMAHQNGVITEVRTNRGTIRPRLVINAAGVFSDEVAAMAGDQFFSIHPRRGTNLILDKKYSPQLLRTVAVKFSFLSTLLKAKQQGHTKGGGLVSTVDGNVLAGPDAAETPERENYATQRPSVTTQIAKFRATSPALNASRLITYFTGVRAPNYEEDFIVRRGRRTRNLIHAAAIQSPGLTAAPAIACDIALMAVEALEAAGISVEKNITYNPVRRCAGPRPARMNDADRATLIAARPDYGVILCRCEEVSRGEILDALRRPVPCDSVDGIKRRVRPGMGRCQGAFCGPLVLRLIAEEKGRSPQSVTKSGAGSEIVFGRPK
jgi:glycerol-3-phosphate dehydrogenase